MGVFPQLQPRLSTRGMVPFNHGTSIIHSSSAACFQALLVKELQRRLPCLDSAPGGRVAFGGLVPFVGEDGVEFDFFGALRRKKGSVSLKAIHCSLATRNGPCSGDHGFWTRTGMRMVFA